MPRALNDQTHAGLSGEGYGMLNVLCIKSWNDKARVSVYAAWVFTVGKTSHIVIVGRHQVECMESRVRPLPRDKTAGRVVVFCEGGMTDCSWWRWRDKAS